MKVKAIFFIVFMTIAGSILLSCIPELPESYGNIALHIRISGYTWKGERLVHVDLHHQTSGSSSGYDLTPDQDNYAYGFFPNLEPGIWDITVTVVDGSQQIGSKRDSAEVLENETTRAEITGEYANGELGLTFSWSSSQINPAISLDASDSIFVVRQSFDTSNWTWQTEELIRSFGWGEFQAIKSVEIEYPDGYVLSFKERGLNSTVWLNVDESEFSAGRNNFYESGEYNIKLTDINGAIITASDQISTDYSLIYSISPSEGAWIDSTIDQPVSWSIDSLAGIKSFAVVVTPEDSRWVVHFSRVVSPAESLSITIPANTLWMTTEYHLFIIACDREITANTLSSVEEYYFEKMISEMVYYMIFYEGIKDIDYMQVAESTFWTN